MCPTLDGSHSCLGYNGNVSKASGCSMPLVQLSPSIYHSSTFLASLDCLHIVVYCFLRTYLSSLILLSPDLKYQNSWALFIECSVPMLSHYALLQLQRLDRWLANTTFAYLRAIFPVTPRSWCLKTAQAHYIKLDSLFLLLLKPGSFRTGCFEEPCPFPFRKVTVALQSDSPSSFLGFFPQ